MTWAHSLRLKIAGVVALVSLVLLVTVGAVVLHQASLDARERLRQQAFDQLGAAVTLYEVTGTVRFGASVDPTRPPKTLREQPLRHPASYYDGATMWAAQRLSSRVLITMAVDGAPLVDTQSQLRGRLIAAGTLAVPVAALMGWAAASGLSRRIRRAAATAERIAAGERTRIAVVGRDEVAALSDAVDAMAEALERRLEAEQAFSANVAHELRTPLAALVSSAELLPSGQAERLVAAQVQRLRWLVEDLLEIARLESGTDVATLTAHDLASLVPDADVEHSEQVLAEPRRVERILTNLISNAERHGGGHVRITVVGCEVHVEDQGPGFPRDLVESGPARFRHGEGGGTGLGLTIAEGQAEAMGATLSFDNKADGGARATLALRPASR